MGFSRQKYWSGLPFPTPKQVHNSMQYFEMVLLFILYSTSCNSLVLWGSLSLNELCYFPLIHINRRLNSILYSKGHLGLSLLSCICNGGYTDDSLTARLLNGTLLGLLGDKTLSSAVCAQQWDLWFANLMFARSFSASFWWGLSPPGHH